MERDTIEEKKNEVEQPIEGRTAQKYRGYNKPNPKGISQYLSNIIISDVTGRSVFMPNEIEIILKGAFQIIGNLILAGHVVDIPDFACLRTKEIEYKDGNKRRFIAVYPQGAMYKRLYDFETPINDDLFMLCLTEQQKNRKAVLEPKQHFGKIRKDGKEKEKGASDEQGAAGAGEA